MPPREGAADTNHSSGLRRKHILASHGPSERLLGIHSHNDSELAASNAIAAIELGATHV